MDFRNSHKKIAKESLFLMPLLRKIAASSAAESQGKGLAVWNSI
jgi:hypothetical protein